MKQDSLFFFSFFFYCFIFCCAFSALLLFICSVVSNSLLPHGLQHARLPCPSLSPWICSDSCPLSRWCHPTHLILCRPLLLLPSISPSIRVFSNESVFHIRWPKYWSFCFSISRSNEYSGLISLRMDWLDLCAVQGTLKSLLQHQSSKASVLRCSTFFMVQLSHNDVVLVGGTQQNDSVIWFFFRFFSHKFITEYWVEFPVLYSRNKSRDPNTKTHL